MLVVVVGGQFGSEGKGAVVGYLARGMLGRDDVCVRVAGPNAGHTVYDAEGRKWALRHIPAAAPVSDCRLVIAPGSEVDTDVLLDEVVRLDQAGHQVSKRLWIHPSATLLTDRHKGREHAAGLVGRIGSTGKGVGAARADRIMREADLVGSVTLQVPGSGIRLQMLGWGEYPWGLPMTKAAITIIEGAQGYGLGLHTSYYPKVTSSDCRAIDFIAMSGVQTLGRQVKVIVVARPNPIRVAGESGPLSGETTWGQLGLEPELTTVTGKTRRVGSPDWRLLRQAVDANGGSGVVGLALTMFDHLFRACRGMTDGDDLLGVPGVTDYVDWVEEQMGVKVCLIGTGPNTMVSIG